MAITKSAKKALRVSDRKRVVNDRIKNKMKAEVKSVRTKVAKKVEVTVADLSLVFKALDKAAKRGTIKKGQANRKKSRLAKAAAKVTK
jgi:small subunit ribosomal protein S20